MTPEQVVQKQLEAYNQRDITQFMSVIDSSITFYDFAEGTQTIKGAEACEQFYAALFKASPNLHSTTMKKFQKLPCSKKGPKHYIIRNFVKI